MKLDLMIKISNYLKERGITDVHIRKGVSYDSSVGMHTKVYRINATGDGPSHVVMMVHDDGTFDSQEEVIYKVNKTNSQL